VLPATVSVELRWGAWRVPPVFQFLQEHGGIAFDEMWRVFNMGLGMLAVLPDEVDPRTDCPEAVEVGQVVPRLAEPVVLRR
jgi:phosphoribosylformylglycinamidine cyclo-ligase